MISAGCRAGGAGDTQRAPFVARHEPIDAGRHERRRRRTTPSTIVADTLAALMSTTRKPDDEQRQTAGAHEQRRAYVFGPRRDTTYQPPTHEHQESDRA